MCGASQVGTVTRSRLLGRRVLFFSRPRLNSTHMPAAKKCAAGKRPSKQAGKKSTCVKKRKASPAFAKWRRAVLAEGYLKPGAAFKPLPKKGTAGYKAIRARYEAAK